MSNLVQQAISALLASDLGLSDVQARTLAYDNRERIAECDASSIVQAFGYVTDTASHVGLANHLNDCVCELKVRAGLLAL